MKKYWQIKPWMMIAVLSVLVVSIVYSFMDAGNPGLTGYTGGKMLARNSVMEMSAAPMMDGDFAYAEDSYDESTTTDRMIVKNASLTMVVEDVRAAIAEITTYAEAKKGFLVSSDVNKYGLELSGYLTVRVPSEMLDNTISRIKDMGEVEGEHIDGRDITEEYVDLESQLGNLEATEAQFLKIMKDAKEIEDILAVQRELGDVRGRIERIEGSMKYLKDSVDLSSLTVYLSTNPSNLPVIDGGDDWKPFAVFKDAVRSLLATGTGIVNAIIWIGVYIPVILVLFLIGWGIKRRMNRKKK